MATFLLRRLGLMVLTLWLLTLMVFFGGQVLPVIPAASSSGRSRRTAPCRPSISISG